MFNARTLPRFVLIVIVSISTASAAEESIDSLLKKLPPPDKLAKPHVQQALADPALKDPLGDRIIHTYNAAEALALARQFVQKQPNSPFARLLHGACAI